MSHAALLFHPSPDTLAPRSLQSKTTTPYRAPTHRSRQTLHTDKPQAAASAASQQAHMPERTWLTWAINATCKAPGTYAPRGATGKHTRAAARHAATQHHSTAPQHRSTAAAQIITPQHIHGYTSTSSTRRSAARCPPQRRCPARRQTTAPPPACPALSSGL